MLTIAAGVCLGIVAAWFLWQMLGFVIGVTVALQEWQDKGALRGGDGYSRKHPGVCSDGTPDRIIDYLRRHNTRKT